VMFLFLRCCPEHLEIVFSNFILMTFLRTS
jgi:hypothetical protein